jgi:hypothetical protein
MNRYAVKRVMNRIVEVANVAKVMMVYVLVTKKGHEVD